MSKALKKLIDINRLREFKNKLVGVGSAYVQTSAVDQTIAGTKTFSKPIVGSVTGSSGSCTGNAATATKATQDSDGNKITTTYSKNGHTHDDRYYTETEVNNLLNGKANSSHTHPYIPTSASCNKNWYWSGQGGQPTWIWGGEDGTNMYVYNPSNFSVNYANSANSAANANCAKFVRTSDNNHTISFDWESQASWSVGLTVDGTKVGGIVTTANSTNSLARVGTYDIGSTVHARTDSQAEYGATVAGSQLKYAAMDSGDGIYDLNRQLTTVGTWLKVSGNSGNTGGSGLYRRIA